MGSEANHGEAGAPPGEVEVWFYDPMVWQMLDQLQSGQDGKGHTLELSEQRSKMPGRSMTSSGRGCGCLWLWKGFGSQRPGIGDQSAAISDLT